MGTVPRRIDNKDWRRPNPPAVSDGLRLLGLPLGHPEEPVKRFAEELLGGDGLAYLPQAVLVRAVDHVKVIDAVDEALREVFAVDKRLDPEPALAPERLDQLGVAEEVAEPLVLGEERVDLEVDDEVVYLWRGVVSIVSF